MLNCIQQLAISQFFFGASIYLERMNSILDVRVEKECLIYYSNVVPPFGHFLEQILANRHLGNVGIILKCALYYFTSV